MSSAEDLGPPERTSATLRRVSSVRTVALQHLSPQLPVRTLQVVVSEGPDCGQRVTAEGDRLTVGTAPGNDLRLSDETVSGYHLELTWTEQGIVVVDHHSTNGTRVGAARIERAVIDPDTELAIGRTRIRVAPSDRAFVDLHPESALGELRGTSPVMRRLMAYVKRIGPSSAPVLIHGESGTGKELVAHALHEASTRRDQPFVTVDCGALVPTLVASELFGHERGAFTGADRVHLGAFEQAHGGTVFLDEVGELSPDLQVHLLGVLERRRIRRVGGSQDVPIDVRVISATHRDLRSEVNGGAFRLDLYYRLAVVCLAVPRLCERPDDVPLLIEHFLRECGYDGPVERYFPSAALRRLEDHAWPGNVRELRNLVEATLAMGEPMTPVDGKPALPKPPRPGIPVDLDLPYKEARSLLLDEFEKRYLTRLLDRTQGGMLAAAREARIARSHLFELLRKCGLR